MLKYITLFAALGAVVLAQDSLMDDLLLEQDLQVRPFCMGLMTCAASIEVLPAPESAFSSVAAFFLAPEGALIRPSVCPRHLRFIHCAIT